MELVIKNIQAKKSTDKMTSLVISIKHLKGIKTNPFQTVPKDRREHFITYSMKPGLP